MIFRHPYTLPRFDYRNNAILVITLAGHERVDHTIPYRWENRLMKTQPEYFFLQYTLSGSGILSSNGKLTEINAGQAFLCSQDSPFLYYHDPKLSDHWEFLWLGFTGLSGQLIFKTIQRDFGQVINLDNNSPTVSRMYQAIRMSESKKWRSITQLGLFATNFLLGLIEDLRHSQSRTDTGRMNEIHQYIIDNYTNHIDASTVSNHFGLSREHFTRLYKKWSGLTPALFISELRLEKAQELLRATNYSLQDVAKLSGFSSVNYLCTVFRNRKGVSPQQYRNRYAQ